MSLVPAVTELMLAELLYLQYDSPTAPVYMYINSTGVQVQFHWRPGSVGCGRSLPISQLMNLSYTCITSALGPGFRSANGGQLWWRACSAHPGSVGGGNHGHGRWGVPVRHIILSSAG